jgi:hypothetical protein
VISRNVNRRILVLILSLNLKSARTLPTTFLFPYSFFKEPLSNKRVFILAEPVLENRASLRDKQAAEQFVGASDVFIGLALR